MRHGAESTSAAMEVEAVAVKGEHKGTGRDPSKVQESGPPQEGHRGLRYATACVTCGWF